MIFKKNIVAISSMNAHCRDKGMLKVYHRSVLLSQDKVIFNKIPYYLRLFLRVKELEF